MKKAYLVYKYNKSTGRLYVRNENWPVKKWRCIKITNEEGLKDCLKRNAKRFEGEVVYLYSKGSVEYYAIV